MRINRIIALGSVVAVVTSAPAIATGKSPSTAAGFSTPSQNITCEFDAAYGRTPAQMGCVVWSVKDATGQPTWFVRPTGKARFVSLQANISIETPVLRYGAVWKRDGITCRLTTAGLTCTNRSGHGYFLSRQKQRTF